MKAEFDVEITELYEYGVFMAILCHEVRPNYTKDTKTTPCPVK